MQLLVSNSVKASRRQQTTTRCPNLSQTPDVTDPEPARILDEPEETTPDVAPDVSPSDSGDEPLPEAANDNFPVVELPATGTDG